MQLETAANLAQPSLALLPYAQTPFLPVPGTLADAVDIGMIAPGVCANTIVETQTGPAAVGDLRAGDKVMTRDHGLQPLLWVGRQDISRDELLARPWLCPVVIEANALKPDFPDKRLMVSQQFLLLVRSRIAQRMVGATEVLVPASQLCQIDGIRVKKDADALTYVSLLFASHQVIVMNGIEAGSLYLDAATLTNLPAAIRTELQPMISETPRPISARMILDGRMGRRLVDRHRRNDKRLIA